MLLALSLGAVPEAAAAGGNVEASLLSERISIAPGVPFQVGIRMKIRHGWHIYWRNPGDSGLPPRVDWVVLPKGFVAEPLEWPIPRRLPENDLMAYGYDGDVILPVRIRPPRTIERDSVTITGLLQWLECRDVCLPGNAMLSLALPVSSTARVDGAGSAALRAARAQLPEEPAGWTLSAEAGPRAIALDFTPRTGIAPRSAYLFVDKPLITEHAGPQRLERRGAGYRLTLEPAANARGNPGRLSGVLVIETRGGRRSQIGVNVDLPVAPGDPPPVPTEQEHRDRAIWISAGALGIAGFGLALRLRRARRDAKPRTERGERS